MGKLCNPILQVAQYRLAPESRLNSRVPLRYRLQQTQQYFLKFVA